MTYETITDLPVPERGGWLATSRGEMWSIEHPHPRDVYLSDIAVGLSRNCRYAGQIMEHLDFYSVAEHSTEMTDWAIRTKFVTYLEDALAILLHDGSEAFFGDMPTPLKALIPEFKAIEDRAQDVIIEGFGLTKDNVRISKADIKLIDLRIRKDERPQMVHQPACGMSPDGKWAVGDDVTPLGITLKCKPPRKAAEDFVSLFVYCVENLPARDPEIYTLIHKHVLDLESTSFSHMIPADFSIERQSDAALSL